MLIYFLRAPQNKLKQYKNLTHVFLFLKKIIIKINASLHLEFCSTVLYTKVEYALPNAPETQNVKNLLAFLWCENTLPKPQDQWCVKSGKDMHVQHVPHTHLDTKIYFRYFLEYTSSFIIVVTIIEKLLKKIQTCASGVYFSYLQS